MKFCLLQARRVAVGTREHAVRVKVSIANVEDFADQAGRALVGLANCGADPGEAMPLVVMIVDAMGKPDALSDALDRLTRVE